MLPLTYHAPRASLYSVRDSGGGPMGRSAWGAAVVLGVALLLAACGGGGASRASGGFRVGLVTDAGKVDDKSFNQSVWEGIQQAQREGPGIAEIKYIETIDPKDYEKNLAQFA